MPNTIRPAAVEDVPALVILGQQFRAEIYTKWPDNPVQMAHTATGLIHNPDGCVFVGGADGCVVGMFGCVVFIHPLTGERVGSEVFWYVTPTERGSLGLRLLHTAEQWAKDHGAVRFQLVAPSVEVQRMCARLGYDPIEVALERLL